MRYYVNGRWVTQVELNAMWSSLNYAEKFRVWQTIINPLASAEFVRKLAVDVTGDHPYEEPQYDPEAEKTFYLLLHHERRW